MVRTVGLDPGTKSMDICGIENGQVFFEKVLETSKVASNPEILIKTLENLKPLDLIVGPSGYGVELTYLDSIPEEKLEDWYYQYVLLTNKEYIEDAIKEDVFGALLYYAMAESVKEMKARDWPVCFIPGVINLPTVPNYRKVNKLDMGTADKLAVTTLGVQDQSVRNDINYSDVSFILLEMGFGYNAVMGVENGVLVDGVGGTTIDGPGFLTMSSMDLELAQLGKNWEKKDVFLGGASTISGKDTPSDLINCLEKDFRCRLAWDSMMEGIEKAVRSMMVSVEDPDKILVSGRLTRIDEVRSELEDRLDLELRLIDEVEGAESVKRTAQGYGVIADGLSAGEFSDLVDHMRIRDGKGSCIDHIYHPKGVSIKDRFVKFKSQ